MDFKDINGKKVPLNEIVSCIDAECAYEIFVGTDSQLRRKDRKVTYVTCIVLYKKGKGGRVFVSKEFKPISSSLRERLANEVWRSLEVAFELTKIVPPNVEIIIHIDVNQSRKHKSSDYYQELVALVTGQGFKCKIKPNAWAAQSVADKFTKKGE